MNPLRKIGLFGGSFDPIHHGHLILGREALESLGLDRVIFIPNGISPHKLARPPAPAELRCRMVEAAVRDEEGFDWDDCEIRRPGPSFAIDTVREMAARHPGAGLYFFIGEDNLASLHTWKDIAELRALVSFVVMSRGCGVPHQEFPVVCKPVDISSTEIRNRIARGLSVRYLVPEAACEIISQHRLYRND
ncbi:MAG: nicotinate-nucleotide adenylyltransferase [Verrucomicrobia bacterium]|nr:nicotinate-nucleotide adenylyltransferase [Verrucomicrobiota bacterium]